MTHGLARLRLLAFVVACVASAPLLARADAGHALPELEGHVVDPTGALSARGRGRIDAELARFRRETTYSLVVYIAPSLAGTSIEDAAYEAFNTWGIGDAGKDTGILLLVAPVERRIRIETGKGAGGAVTDLQANSIIQAMGPLMARGDIEKAIAIGVDQLEVIVRKEVGPAKTDTRTARSRDSHMGWLTGVLIAVIVVGVVLALAFGRRRRTRRGEEQGLMDNGNGAQKAKAAGAALEIVGGLLRVIGAIASKSGGSAGGKRRSGGGGGKSGGGGSSGGY